MSYKKSLKYTASLAKVVLIPLLAITVSVIAVDGPTGKTVTQMDMEPFTTLATLDSEPEENFVMNPGGENFGASVGTDSAIESLIFKKDTSIKDALRFLAAKYHKNIVPSPKVDGVLTVTTLYEVTFEEALNVILGHTFKYEQEGNFIRVYTADEYAKFKQDPARMTYRVFTLYYITAAEASKLISPALSSIGSVKVTTAAETGVPTGETISAQTGGGDTTAMNDTIVIYDFPENIAMAEEIINSVDVKPKQVLIEATILSATLTEEMQFGIDWQTLKGSVITALTGITHGASEYVKSAGTSAIVEGALTGGLTIGFAHDDVAAFIRAVEEVSDVTILANPKILAINKQLGQVYIGNKLGYRVGDTFDAQGNRVEGEVKFLDTGTKLSFRPYIGDDGYIRMDIHPKDSSGSVPGGIPQETSAELVTNIMVKNGQTIVIGGLFRDKTTNVKTQVPVLGDLPVVGDVFKGTADQVVRQEVIVLLTPHIIEEPEEALGEARAADVNRKRYGARTTLLGISRTRLADDRYANAVRYYAEGNTSAALHEVDSALNLRPTYLEALRLKEKIVRQIAPDDIAKMERIMLGVIEKEETRKWLRR